MFKKKKIYLVLSVILAVALLSACGGNSSPDPAPAPTPAPSNNQSTTPPPADETVYELNVNLTGGEPGQQNYLKLFRELEEESGGRLQCTVYFAGSLLAIPDIPKGLQSGVAEISSMATNNYTSIMPLNSRILQFPFMGLKDPGVAVEILTQLQAEFPEMQKEFDDLGIINLGNFAFPPYNLHFSDEKIDVRVPADVKGLKIMTNKIEFQEILNSAGAAPVQMSPSDVYTSLEKNVIDGYANSYGFAPKFGLTDVSVNHLEFGEYGAWLDFSNTGINAAFFNSLPEDLQQIIVNKFATKGYIPYQDELDMTESFKATGEARGDKFVTLTDEELAQWSELGVAAHQNAIDEINAARGDDAASRIYARALELIAERFGN